MNIQAIIVLLVTAADIAVAGRPWFQPGSGRQSSDARCLTKMRPGNGRVRPAALTTRSSTYTTTVTEVTTTSGAIQSDNVIVTSIPLTAPTSLRIFGEQYTTICANTSTFTISPTQTIYTGYLDTATSIPASDHQELRVLNHNAGSFGGFKHSYGHALDFSRQRAYRVDCIVHETVTTTETVARSTSLATESSQASPAISNCTTTVGSVTASTTQHIKCAPTNLVSEYGGHGINSVAGRDTFALAAASDASACCQLCVETEECAASEADVEAGNCFLWFTTGANNTCGLSLVYSDDNRSNAPGSGFVLQTGCGRIEPAVSS